MLAKLRRLGFSGSFASRWIREFIADDQGIPDAEHIGKAQALGDLSEVKGFVPILLRRFLAGPTDGKN